jgi:hypothetical protein
MAAIDEILIPSLTLEEILSDGSTLTNPAADHRRLFLGEDGLLHLRDSAGTVTTLQTYSGPTWTTGTSMPGGPTTNDRITRTDEGRDYYYDGTRWLSVVEHRIDLSNVDTGLQAFSVTTGLGRRPAPYSGTKDLWLTRWEMTTRVSTTNDGTKYWSNALRKITAAVAVTTISTLTTVSDAPDTFVYDSASIGALLNNGTTHTTIDIVATKVSTPGNLDVYATLYYRLVGT